MILWRTRTHWAKDDWLAKEQVFTQGKFMLFVGKCEEWSEKLDFNRALPTPDKKFCFGQGLP